MSTLGTLAKNATNKHIKNKLIDNINRGGLTVSTIKFHRDYKTMEHMFYGHHPAKYHKQDVFCKAMIQDLKISPQYLYIENSSSSGIIHL